nr:unnamed protein product [Callosobruchus chinensis]
MNRNETDSEDSGLSDPEEQYEGLLKKALDVTLPENFCPSSAPQDGFEYLQNVIYERKNHCDDVVIANIDVQKFSARQTYHVKLDNKTLFPYAPTPEWQNAKLEEFKVFRQIITAHICNPPKIDSVENNFIDDMIASPPQFSQAISYSQACKTRMLKIILQYLANSENNSIAGHIGTWIFTILALLEIPLSPDCCNVLRQLAKRCIEIRAPLKEDEDDVYIPMNFYICIISKYFSQLDLAD